MGKFAGGLDRGVFVGKFGEWDGFWEERDGVYDAFGMCAWYPDAVALVMVEGWAKVPAVRTMRGPSLAGGGFFVDDDSGSSGCEGCACEIEGTLELGIGQEFGVEARGAEEIKGQFGLG